MGGHGAAAACTARARRGKHWGHTLEGADGTCRKEPPNPSRAVGNCPDGRRILHIVAQTAPEARNRTGPDRDAEQHANSFCGAMWSQIRHARRATAHGLQKLRVPPHCHGPADGAWPPGLRAACRVLPHRPLRAKAHGRPERSKPASRAERGPYRSRPARRVRSGGRACSGSINMIMMRAWATVIRPRSVHPPPPRAGCRRKEPEPPPKARSPYPQCPASGLHTGPVHRPC